MRQALSLDSQLQECLKFADRAGLNVVKIFPGESKSAKTPNNRPIFEECLQFIRDGNADGILSWEPNRLARNLMDGGQIQHLLDLGILKDLKFPNTHFENTSTGKFMLSMLFSQAKFYVDDLSQNVRRGMNVKLNQGWAPFCAPVGYLNIRDFNGARIITDGERFPMVQRLWKLFLTGYYSVPQLLEEAHKMGLTIPVRRKSGGSLISRSGLFKMLGSEFYAGYFWFARKRYVGKHEPMITLKQFNEAQALLGRIDRPRMKQREFAYRGLMTCGECGFAVTAEETKKDNGKSCKSYIYYHCSHKRKEYECRQRSVEEKELDRQVQIILNGFSIGEREADACRKAAAELMAKESSFFEGVRRERQKKIERLQKSLDNLTRLRVEDRISDDEFERQRGILKNDLVEAERSASSRTPLTDNWFETIEKGLNLLKSLEKEIKCADSIKMAQLLKELGSNPRLTDKKLSINGKKHLLLISKKPKSSSWWNVVTAVRNILINRPPDAHSVKGG
ncbi:MAG: recombinase family protein [Planctomycetes bacterium]|nr:recombinase family protein [Planctomycetota bacterium]